MKQTQISQCTADAGAGESLCLWPRYRSAIEYVTPAMNIAFGIRPASLPIMPISKTNLGRAV
jgi:hypothetical protein